MTKTLPSIFFLVLAGCATHPAPNLKPVPSREVLVTYFDPFAGATLNLSKPVAENLAKDLPALVPGVNVTLCRIPVVYDEGTKVAIECLNRFRSEKNRSPELMVSLGEAACQIQIETQAENRDQCSIADNAQVFRKNKKILKKGSTWQPLGLPAEEMLKELRTPEERKHVILSKSAGNFVCNNTAYLLAHELSEKSGSPRYGFIHVPNHDCQPAEADPDLNASLIARLLAKTMN